MERLQILCDNAFSEEIISQLNEFSVLRNSIVHDVSDKRYSLFDGVKAYEKFVIDYFDTILGFIEEARDILTKEGVNVCWYDMDD